MGPIQGAIVNWFGHKMGYTNYNNGDHSRNTSPWGILLLGELFQNNHHGQKDNANFARKWYEFDPTYFVMRGLHALKIIRLKPLNVQAIPQAGTTRILNSSPSKVQEPQL
jgi:stearoyl-CoA desaturase (delta-9 desaturase)